MADIPKIQFKRTYSVGKKPTDSDLKWGEIALNGADNSFFVKHSDNHIIRLGAGSLGNDSDIRYHVDSDGKIYGSSLPESHHVVFTDSDTDDWQLASEMRSAGAGSKVTVFRRLADNVEAWSQGSNVTTTNTGWDGVVGGGNVAILDYNGTASYAFTNSIFNNTFRLETAYIENGDCASLSQLNNYFVCQIFMNTVSIGNGTILGQFENGRSIDWFQEYSVEFYDANGNLITSQSWTGGTSVVTNDINVTGNINGVRSIIMRGHNGNAYHPAFNDVNFYVNGSTDFPTTNWGSDSKWGGAWRGYAGGTNRNDTEVFALVHLSSTAAMLSGHVGNLFSAADWAPNGNTDNTNQQYLIWLHRPWAISEGTYFNGRTAFPNQYWLNVRIQYHDHDDIVVEDWTDTFAAQSQSGNLKAHKDVWKIVIRPSVRTAANLHPVLQNFFLQLSDWTVQSGITVNDNSELWIKLSSSPSVPTAFGNGTTPTTVWNKIT